MKGQLQRCREFSKPVRLLSYPGTGIRGVLPPFLGLKGQEREQCSRNPGEAGTQPQPVNTWLSLSLCCPVTYRGLSLANPAGSQVGQSVADEVHTGTQGRTGKEGEWIAGGEGTSRISNVLI